MGTAQADRAARLNSMPAAKHVQVTGETIRRVFAQHPEVQDQYFQMVPLHLSEREFWTRYYTRLGVEQRVRAISAAQSKAGDESVTGDDQAQVTPAQNPGGEATALD